MRMSMKGMAAAFGLLWGGAVLLVGLVHLKRPSYGEKFLEGVSSIYPGFHGGRDVNDALVGGGYAVVDGAMGGLMLACVYNLFADEDCEA